MTVIINIIKYIIKYIMFFSKISVIIDKVDWMQWRRSHIWHETDTFLFQSKAVVKIKPHLLFSIEFVKFAELFYTHLVDLCFFTKYLTNCPRCHSVTRQRHHKVGPKLWTCRRIWISWWETGTHCNIVTKIV